MTMTPFTVSAAERARIAEFGMYRPDLESDACGVGLIAATDGKPSRRVVIAGIEALKAVWHRGAVDADGKTGDGAGINVELPLDFFHEHIGRAGHKPKPNLLAVGQVFLPRTDLAAQETCRTIVESEIIGFGYKVYGWRRGPPRSRRLKKTCISSAAVSRKRSSKPRPRAFTSARCRRARSSTRGCSSPKNCRFSIPT